MATINRIPVLWSGAAGLPGFSLFYAQGGIDATADIKTFFTALGPLCPTTMTWQVPVAGDTLDDASGAINGTWTGTGSGIVTASGTGNYAAGGGAWVRWLTTTIVGRRRLQGRTFICPLTTGQYDSAGSLATTCINTIVGAANVLVATQKLVIWSRPEGDPPTGGSSALISAALVKDQVTSLRSRRS